MVEIAKHLLISPVKIHPANIDCQYYAGPVIFGIMSGFDLKSAEATANMKNLRVWMSKQPATKPHTEVPYGLSLGKLTETNGRGGFGWEVKTY
jgi:hypothetical protein